MSDLTEKLRLIVDIDGARAVREMQRVGTTAERELGKAEGRINKMGRAFSSVGVGMVGTGAVLAAALYKSAQASEEANLQHLKLENTLRNAPKLAGETADAFEEQAEALQKVTAADGDAIIGAQAMLGTFSLTKDEITGITPLVVDYARKFGVDLTDAATQVGKALDGNVGALKRNGVSIDEAAYATDRYSAVQSALAAQVGGFAQAEGATFTGQLEIMKNSLGDIQEGVGVGAVNAFTKLLGPVQSASHWFTALDESTQESIGTVGAFGAAALLGGGALSTLIGQAIKARENFSKLSVSIKGLDFSKVIQGGAVAGIAAGLVLAKHNVDEMNKGVKEMLNVWGGLDSSVATVDKMSDRMGKMRGQIDAGEASLAKMKTGWQQLNIFERIQNEPAQQAIVDQLKEADLEMQKLKGTAEEMGKTNGKSADENLRFLMSQKEVGKEFGNTTQAVEALNAEEEKNRDIIKEITSALDAAKNAVKGYYDEVSGRINTDIAYEASLDELTSSIAENGLTLDIHTEKGRNNMQALIASKDAIVARGLAIAQETGDVNKASAATQGMVDQLRNEMTVRGFSKQQVDFYIASLKLTPTDIETQFRAPGLSEAVDKAHTLEQLFARLNNIGANFTANTRNFFGPAAPPGRADGGPTSAGMMYQVGERGRPELYTQGGKNYLIPGDAGQVTPAMDGGGTSAPAHIEIILGGQKVFDQFVEMSGHQRMVMT